MMKAYTLGISTKMAIARAMARNCIKMEMSMTENGLMISQMGREDSSRLTGTSMREAGKMDKLMDTADILQMTVKSI